MSPYLAAQLITPLNPAAPIGQMVRTYRTCNRRMPMCNRRVAAYVALILYGLPHSSKVGVGVYSSLTHSHPHIVVISQSVYKGDRYELYSLNAQNMPFSTGPINMYNNVSFCCLSIA